jgi:hypothetical protein
MTTISRLVRFFVLTIWSGWLTFPKDQFPIAIRQYNGRPVGEVKQDIIEVSSNLNFAPPGVVIKWSWVSSAARSVESALLHDCSLFGTTKHYYSFLACPDNHSPATNHLFLLDDTESFKSSYWNLFRTDAKVPASERHGLWVYISPFAGHSLVTAHSSKALIRAVFHACLGTWS